MSNKIFKLARFLINPDNQNLRSHHYRFKETLDLKCGDLEVFNFIESPKDLELWIELSKYGPLDESDFSDISSQKKINQWNKIFIADPKFYRMVLQQRDLWSRYESKTLSEFILSSDGSKWVKLRQKINRNASFELDQFFKRTKVTALNHEIEIRKMIRYSPHIGFKDLKKLKIKNAQQLLERFPHQKHHQDLSLNSLIQKFSILKGSRTQVTA